MLLLQPGVVDDLLDVVSLAHFAVEHASDQVDAFFAHDVGDAKVAVHDFIDAVEGILLVDDSVEKDAECPDVLLLPTIRLAGEDFGSCVI